MVDVCKQTPHPKVIGPGIDKHVYFGNNVHGGGGVLIMDIGRVYMLVTPDGYVKSVCWMVWAKDHMLVIPGTCKTQSNR